LKGRNFIAVTLVSKNFDGLLLAVAVYSQQNMDFAYCLGITANISPSPWQGILFRSITPCLTGQACLPLPADM
jgi:hypothetical protein